MGPATARFSRLYLFPSVYHCGGGYANATTPDLIYPMVQWVEQGSAPSELTISYAPTGTSPFTRPVYPYPFIPKYNGSGDPNNAASFHAVPSPGAHYTDWYGNYLFFQPIGGRGWGRNSE
jgi:tannase/feruloyl esterase